MPKKSSPQTQIERDVTPRVVEVPPALSKALKGHKEANAIFQQLSYSHQKEYVDWINSAKKEETRAARLEKLIPMLTEKHRGKA